MKLKTVGISPKVPVQAVTTLIVAALAYFGVDLDPEVSGALGVVVGFIAGYLAPAAPALPVSKKANGESGQGLVEALVVIFLVLVILLVLLRIV